MTPKTRSRLILLLILVMFFGSFGIALVLHYSGWSPARTRNHGQFVTPPIDLRAITLGRTNGDAYPWRPEAGVWRVLVAAPAGCQAPCAALIDTLRRVWVGEGRFAEDLDVLWVGELPAAAPVFRKLLTIEPDPVLLAALPDSARTDAIPLYLIDPSGYLIMRYEPDFDPSGLRKDLYRLLK